MFTHIKLQNFKAIKSLDLPLSPITAFIGPNDSGKSSILQAIHLATQVAISNKLNKLNNILIGDWQLDQLQTKNVYEPIFFEFDGKFFDSEIMSFQWSFKLEKQKFEILNQKLHYDKKILNIAEGIASNRKLRLKINFAEYLHFNPNKLKQPSYSEKERSKLQSDGSNLPSVLAAMQGLERDRFEELEKRFIEIVPTIKRILIGPAPVVKDEVENIRIGDDVVSRKTSRRYTGHCLYVDTVSGDRIPAAHISDGSMLILGYLTVLFSENRPNLLLIEEPETGIHPKSLKIVMETFRNCPDRDNVQILMTSHSPYLIDFLEPEEIVLTRRENGYTETARLDELPDIRKWLENLSPGELWTMGGEDELMERIRQKRGGNG